MSVKQSVDLIAQRNGQKYRYFQTIFIAMVADLKCFRVTSGQVQDLHKEKEQEKV